MTWTWNRASRRPDRGRRRPRLEALEVRNLLSHAPAPSIPPPGLAALPAETFSNQAVDPIDALTGASKARAAFGVSGQGMAVAVIDTGVNYHHEAFGGGFGPGAKVEGGWDFGDNDADPDATTWQHGTAVAGILASADPSHPGVAPDAQIVALRVFGNDNSGDFNKIANALQWVIDHHSQYGITAVNLSITDGNNYARDQFSHDGAIGQRINSKIEALKSLNIPVVSAAGNSFKGQQGMGFTAILPDTISVTGTDASDHLAGDAQRLGAAVGGASATDIAAPSVGVTGPIDGDGFSTLDGTSFAAPQVTGAVVLLQQLYQRRFGHLPAVDDVVSWLRNGADPITDPVTGITLGRLDVLKAAAQVPSPSTSGQIVDPPAASDSGPASGSDASNGTTSPPTQPQTPASPTPPPKAPVDPPTPPSDPSPPAPPASDPPASPPADSGPPAPPGDMTPPPPPVTGPAEPVPPPVAPPVQPSDPPRSPDAPKVGTAIVIDGHDRGNVDSFAEGSPLEEFLKALGPGASIDRVQSWTALDPPAESVAPGGLQAAGSIVSIFRRQVPDRGRHRPIKVVHRPRPEVPARAWHAGFARSHRSD